METPYAMHRAAVYHSQDYRDHWLLACDIGAPVRREPVIAPLLGSFSWALLQMKAGKKVTRPGLRWWFYIQTTPDDHEGFIVKEYHLGMVLFADIDQPNLLAPDWVLAEEAG